MISKKLPTTPRSKVKQALRQLSMRSRERASALKSAGYKCEKCGVKQSRAKGKEVYVECHHRSRNIPWEHLIDYILKHLLVPSEEWKVLCKDCHKKEHENKKPGSCEAISPCQTPERPAKGRE